MGGTPHDSRLSQCSNGTTSKILRPLTNMQWQQHTEESYPEPAVQHSSTILLQYLQLHTPTYLLIVPGNFFS
jgi:hypothetical protein